MASSSSNTTTFTTRTNGGGIPQPLTVEIPPLTATTFEAIPLCLPERIRDVMNESPKERLRTDLYEHLSKLRGELVVTMDSKRYVFDDLPNRDQLLKAIRDEEERLTALIDAVKLVIESLN